MLPVPRAQTTGETGDPDGGNGNARDMAAVLSSDLTPGLGSLPGGVGFCSGGRLGAGLTEHGLLWDEALFPPLLLCLHLHRRHNSLNCG